MVVRPGRGSGEMPIQAITPEEARAAMEAAQSDLKWLMADNGVDDRVQELIYHHGFTRTKLFVGMAESRTELRDVLKAHLGLDAAEGLEERRRVAVVLVAWEGTKEFSTKDNEVRADARVAHSSRPISVVDHSAMRAAFEEQFGRLHNSEVPGKYYLGKKTDDIEDNEPKAEQLREVHSKEDGEEDYLTANVDGQGNVRVRKGARDTFFLFVNMASPRSHEV